jgi:multiple sugar transport system ATP-binding protein
MSRILLDKANKVYSNDGGKIVHAIDNLTLSVAAGEYLVVAGPSGCGKSTLLRLIAGLESLTGGEIYFDERPMKGIPPKDRDLAMVFQQDALFPHLTVRQNIGFGLRLRHEPHEEVEKQVNNAARLLGLEDCLERLPEKLSGGQRQRAALGRAMVRRPKAILLDEPLSSLDAPLRVQLRTELRRIHRELGCSIIHVTHDQSEAMALGGRIAIMNQGKLSQAANPQTVYEKPTNTFVARFIGSPPMNLFEATLAFNSNSGVFPMGNSDGPPFRHAITERENDHSKSSASPATIIGIRCEHVRFRSFGAAQDAPAGLGTIERVETMGALRIAYGTISGCEFTAQVEPGEAVSPGMTLPVFFDMAKACRFDATTGLAL